MKKKVLLPFEDTPYSLMYHYGAFPMGIIQGNATSDITPWLCSQYINCWFDKNEKASNKFTIYTSYSANDWADEDKILIQQRAVLNTDLYNWVFDDLILSLRKMLDMGYYPNGNYNEEYIPDTAAYQKRHRGHDYILIGYDDISKNFISVGYLKNGKFKRHLVPYDNMKKSLESFYPDRLIINFWKYNTDIKFELNLTRTISELSDYLNFTTSKKIFSKDKYWGMFAMRRLATHFMDSAKNENYIDVRYTRGVMEHKFYMQMRIEYLLNNKILQDTTYLEKAKEVYEIAKTMHLLGLKYNMTQKESIVLHMCDIMDKMLLIENNYLHSVLADLKNNICEVKA